MTPRPLKSAAIAGDDVSRPIRGSARGWILGSSPRMTTERPEDDDGEGGATDAQETSERIAMFPISPIDPTRSVILGLDPRIHAPPSGMLSPMACVKICALGAHVDI